MKVYIKYLFLLLFIPGGLALGQLHHFQIQSAGGGTIPSETAGTPFFIEIIAQDSVNATVTSFTGAVDISSNGTLSSGGGVTSSFTDGMLTGIAVKFSNTGNFSLTATNTPGIESGTSNLFTVNPGSAAIIRVETAADGSGTIVPSQPVAAGLQLFVYSIARDTMNNFAGNIAGSSWSLSNSTGGITGSDLVPNPDNKGAVFTGHITGSAEISVAATGLTAVNSGILTVVPATKAKLKFAQKPGDGLAGAPLSPPALVQVEDAFGNNVAEAGDTVTLSIPAGQGVLNGTLVQLTNGSGIASFAGLTINQPGQKTLVASSPALSPAFSDTFTLSTLFITATSNANGVISPAGNVQVIYGGNQSFSIMPDTGYHLDSIVVDGTRKDSTTSFTFDNIIANHSISAFFSINNYTITSSSGANGTISPRGTLIYSYGSTHAFSITADADYHIDSVVVDGVSFGAIASYTFSNITGNHIITASFSADIPIVNIKLFLQGPYSGGSMSTSLNGILPKNQPYSGLPWNYGGAESVLSIPSAAVDWILIELRSGTGPGTRVARRAAFIRSDGGVADLDGTTPVKFNNTPTGSYYIVVRHRNHLAVMSSLAVMLNASSALYDFTQQLSNYYGGQAANLGGGMFGMFGGDYSGDNFIDSDDFTGPDNELFRSGYRRADHSMDGFIDSDDFIYPDNNMFKGSKVPN